MYSTNQDNKGKRYRNEYFVYYFHIKTANYILEQMDSYGPLEQVYNTPQQIFSFKIIYMTKVFDGTLMKRLNFSRMPMYAGLRYEKPNLRTTNLNYLI